MGPDYKVLGKTLSGDYSYAEERAHLSCKMCCLLEAWQRLSLTGISLQPQLLWVGGKMYLEFPRFQQGKHFPSDALSPPLPCFLTLLQLLYRQNEFPVFIQKAVAQILVKKRFGSNSLTSWHAVMCVGVGNSSTQGNSISNIYFA